MERWGLSFMIKERGRNQIFRGPRRRPPPVEQSLSARIKIGESHPVQTFAQMNFGFLLLIHVSSPVVDHQKAVDPKFRAVIRFQRESIEAVPRNVYQTFPLNRKRRVERLLGLLVPQKINFLILDSA